MWLSQQKFSESWNRHRVGERTLGANTSKTDSIIFKSIQKTPSIHSSAVLLWNVLRSGKTISRFFRISAARYITTRVYNLFTTSTSGPQLSGLFWIICWIFKWKMFASLPPLFWSSIWSIYWLGNSKENIFYPLRCRRSILLLFNFAGKMLQGKVQSRVLLFFRRV